LEGPVTKQATVKASATMPSAAALACTTVFIRPKCSTVTDSSVLVAVGGKKPDRLLPAR
jgi:hypothetical protein